MNLSLGNYSFKEFFTTTFFFFQKKTNYEQNVSRVALCFTDIDFKRKADGTLQINPTKTKLTKHLNPIYILKD